MTKAGETAVVVPVPGVDALRQRWVPDRRDSGMPAHVTLLYPFVANAPTDAAVQETLRREFASVPAFDVRFDGFERFPGVLYLVPEPVDVFLNLTQRLMVLFPQCRPYNGAYEGITPHLTIAHNLGWSRFNEIEAQAQPQLPFLSQADCAFLMQYDGQAWNLCKRFPFLST